MENFPEFASWAEKAIITGVCAYGVNILKELKQSIDELNKQVAEVLVRTDWHKEELGRLDVRVSNLERRSNWYGSSGPG
jgi:hypothetical protein